MAVGNDQARSKHPRQGSTQVSHVWTRQLNSQAYRTEKRRESFLAVHHGGFVAAKTWPEHGGTRPGIVLPTPAHLAFMSGFKSRVIFYGNTELHGWPAENGPGPGRHHGGLGELAGRASSSALV